MKKPVGNVDSDRLVLLSAELWKATPHNYSSLRYLRFKGKGSAELVYAYGQTIFAVVECRWELPRTGRLRLTYTAVPRGGSGQNVCSKGHQPAQGVAVQPG
jgi:hypothetical protein